MSQLNGALSPSTFLTQFGNFLSHTAFVPVSPVGLSSGFLSGVRYGAASDPVQLPVPMLDVPHLFRSDQLSDIYEHLGVHPDARPEDHPQTKIEDSLPLTSLRDQYYAIQSRIYEAAHSSDNLKGERNHAEIDSFARSLLTPSTANFQDLALGQLASGVAYATFFDFEGKMPDSLYESSNLMAKRAVAGFAGSGITFFRMGYYHAAAFLFELSIFAERILADKIKQHFDHTPGIKFGTEFPRANAPLAWMNSLRLDRSDFVENRIARAMIACRLGGADKRAAHYINNRALQAYQASGDEESVAATYMRMAWARLSTAASEAARPGASYEDRMTPNDWNYVSNMIGRGISVWNEGSLRSDEIIAKGGSFAIAAGKFFER